MSGFVSITQLLRIASKELIFSQSTVLISINIATENKERKWLWKRFLKFPDRLLNAFFLTSHYFWSFSLNIQNIWPNLRKTNIWNGDEGIMKRNNNFLMNMIPIILSIVQNISYSYIDWEVLFDHSHTKQVVWKHGPS